MRNNPQLKISPISESPPGKIISETVSEVLFKRKLVDSNQKMKYKLIQESVGKELVKLLAELVLFFPTKIMGLGRSLFAKLLKFNFHKVVYGEFDGDLGRINIFGYLTMGIVSVFLRKKAVKTGIYLKNNLIIGAEKIFEFIKNIRWTLHLRQAFVFVVLFAVVFSPLTEIIGIYISENIAKRVAIVMPRVNSAYAAVNTDVYIFHTVASGSTFTVPLDWNPASNSIEVIGAGGGGAGDSASTAGVSDGGGGGGGGGYSKITNLSLTPGNSVQVGVGTGGTHGATPTDGGHTWFNMDTFANCTDNTICVKAEGGEGGNVMDSATLASSSGGDFGSTASAVGTTRRRGGDGGRNHTTTGTPGGGGGGAAGKFGHGGNGANAATTAGFRGSGGGGNDNGTAGSAGTSATAGGTGGNGYGGAGSSPGGAGGASGGNGTNGGGGGGSDGDTTSCVIGAGGTGSLGGEWVAGTFGSGGGGGGGGGCNDSTGSANDGGAGGSPAGYGGGGGGGGGNADTGDSEGNGGDGGNGLIVIKYRPLAVQTKFQWLNDSGALDSGTSISAVNIKASGSEGLTINTTYRLRLQVANIKNYAGSAFSSHKFRLEMARAGTSCTSLASGWDWRTVPVDATLASHAFDIEATSNFVNGASTSSSTLTAPTGATTFTNGYGLDTMATTSGTQTIADDAFTEIEWALKPNSNANTSADYCFRAGWIVDPSATPDTRSSMSYSKIASASVQAEPTYDQSSYRWFTNADEASITGTSQFDTDGMIDFSAGGANIMVTSTTDGEYIYVAGENSALDWYIKKYNKTTGAICSSTANCATGEFGTGGTVTQTEPGYFWSGKSMFVDDDYLYVVGTNTNASDYDSYIVKYNKDTGSICSNTTNCPAGAFDTDGMIVVTGTASNRFWTISVDADYVYVTGDDNSGTDARIDKYNKNTGAICSNTTNCSAGAFDTDGTMATTGTGTNYWQAIAVDADYIYVAGRDNGSDARLDKYNKTTGAICSNTTNCSAGAFDTDGIIATAGTGNNYWNSITVDGDHIYTAGVDNAGADGRIDKYNKTTGAICSNTTNCPAGAFDTDGIIATAGTGNNSWFSIAVDADYIYVAGRDNDSDVRIDKYNKTTGAICSSTANCPAGIFDTDGIIATTGTGTNIWDIIIVDADFLYAVGNNNTQADWLIAKYNNETGALCASANCPIDYQFDTDGTIATTGTDVNDWQATVVDGDYVYVAGYDNANGDARIDKYNKTTGAICSNTTNCPAGAFDTDGTIATTGTSSNAWRSIAVDADYIYVVGYDNANGDARIDKYNKTTGAICDSTANCPAGAFDTDGIIATVGTGTNYWNSIYVDADYVYVAGYDNSNLDGRIDKYNKTTGAICSNTTNCVAGAFDTDGTIATTGTNTNYWFSITVDADFIYVAGQDNSGDGRIDKYNKTTGAICDSTANCPAGAFDTDGIIATAGTGNNYWNSIAVDADFIYVAGIDNTNDARIDKYNKTTGTICSDTTNCPAGAFDTDGIIATAGTGNNSWSSIAVDADYIYVAGYDNASDARLDKYNKTTGAICSNTTNCVAGAFDTDGTIATTGTNTNYWFSITVDADFIYVAGQDNNDEASLTDARLDKYNNETGAIADTSYFAGGAQVGAVLAAQDTSYTMLSDAEVVRLRFTIHANTNNIYAGKAFKLQFAMKSGTCAASSFSDVTTGTALSFYNNSNITSGGDINPDVTNDPVHSGHANTYQAYFEANAEFTALSTVANNTDGIWDVALYENGAPTSITYCFRVVESDDTTLVSYVYPEIITFNGTVTFQIPYAGGGHGTSYGGSSGGGTPQSGGGAGGGAGGSGGEGDSGGGGAQGGGGAGGGGGGSPVMFDFWLWLYGDVSRTGGKSETGLMVSVLLSLIAMVGLYVERRVGR